MNPVIKSYFWAEKIWFKIPQKLRFLLVGGFNTLIAYLILLCINALLHACQIPLSDEKIASIALFIQYVITINISFLTMRYYVFQSHGNWKKEYIKALSVYALMFCINMPIMTAFMTFFGWPVRLAQAVYLVLEIILTFLLHKYYSFKKQPAEQQP